MSWKNIFGNISRAPILGKKIGFDKIYGQVFRVLDFDRNGTDILPDGTVKAKSMFKPYGFLYVESPIIDQMSRLPIFHRDDFMLADSVFGNIKLNNDILNDQELLVTYYPQSITNDGMSVGIFHTLHYVIVPRKTLEKIYQKYDHEKIRQNLEKFFGSFSWTGVIRVQVNLDLEP